MRAGNTEFELNAGKVYIMGVVNITPDSFSDGGQYNSPERMLKHVEELIRAGADIIDIGAESTRPGAEPMSSSEEAEKIHSAVSIMRKYFDLPVSVDSYRSSTIRAALDAGADIINDVWGLRYGELNGEDDDMAGVAAEYGVPVVITHNGAHGPAEDITGLVMEELEKSVELALSAGVRGENIILDPGIGFHKTREENLKLLKELPRLKECGYPLLLGASRKSVIGDTLHLPVDQREEATLVTTILAAEAGFDFVRVHDVEKNRRALDMFRAVKGA